MGIDFTFKKNPFYVLLLMGGIALTLFLFHLFTGGRYQETPSNPFSGIRNNDQVILRSSGKEYSIPPEKFPLLRTIDPRPHSPPLQFTDDHSLNINKETYPFGIIDLPLPVTIIQTPRGEFFYYSGHLLRDLDIPFTKEKNREPF